MDLGRHASGANVWWSRSSLNWGGCHHFPQTAVWRNGRCVQESAVFDTGL